MCNVEKQLIPQRYHHQIIKAPTLLHEWPVMNGIHKDNASLGLKLRKKTCVCISALFYWASLPLSAADTERWHHLLRTLTTLHRSQETLDGGCPLVVYWPPRGSSYTVVSRVFVEPKTINHVWHCASDVWQNPVSPAQSSPLLDSCAVCWNWPWRHMTLTSARPSASSEASEGRQVHIKAPYGPHTQDYLDRKLFHYFQPQTVCDSTGICLDICVGFSPRHQGAEK